MSNIYIQEPPTNGKVLLKTTAGDIDIELWSKEAPKACRNFIQLCMEDYYSNTIFHRVVPGFIVQGGDPTGTGSGGESIYGAPFKDEFHSRLRFNRRGLVAMANAGPHDNGSQFFFTLGRADELNSKHTIFGKITGDTIYNMLRLAEVETDNDERPVNPHKIRITEVLFNPFDDIIPRTSKKLKNDKTVEDVKKAKSKGTKNFSLLSFGEEAEEEEEEVNKVSQSMKGKSKSSHDLLKDDPHLSSVPAIESEKAGDSHNSDEEEEKDEYSGEDDDLDSDEKHQMKERIAQKLKKDTNLPVKKSTTEEEMEKKSSRRVATLEGDAGVQPRDESSEGQVQRGSGRRRGAASGSAPWGLSEGPGASSPLPVRVLLIGNSTLFWAKKRAEHSGFGTQLGLGSRASIVWVVSQDMLWEQFLPALFQYLKESPPPQVMVVHLGENDLTQRKSISLRVQIRQDFSFMRAWCPGIRIIWSNFLPRRAWSGARNVRKVDLARKKINDYVAHFIRSMGGAVIQHPQIVWRRPELFLPDGVHLSPQATDVFLVNLQQGLCNFL